ncbi:MAG: hypothetical protein GX660_18660 [Clostridiaceae bacterium]|nr:hypothetical protein [Clostridiaceae bacterium]
MTIKYHLSVVSVQKSKNCYLEFCNKRRQKIRAPEKVSEGVKIDLGSNDFGEC